MSCAQCIKCGHGKTYYNKRRKKILCEKCGSGQLEFDEFFEGETNGFFTNGSRDEQSDETQNNSRPREEG